MSYAVLYKLRVWVRLPPSAVFPGLRPGKTLLRLRREDEKQKLREGKTSISKVYQEIVSSENPQPQKESSKLPQHGESAREVKNKAELLALLERMTNQELFCPQCGTSMFECSRCHKTLKELSKENAQPIESQRKEAKDDSG